MNLSFKLILIGVLIMGFNHSQNQTDWKRDNLKGAVASITTSTVHVINDSSKALKRPSNYSFVSKYDTCGYQLSKITYDESGNIEKWVEFKRDSLGFRKVESSFTSDSILKETKITRYSEIGLIIETQAFSPTGLLLNKWTYEYDETGGFECQIKQYAPNGKHINTWRYFRNDNKDTLLMTERNSKGKLLDSFAEVSDSNGNLWQSTRYVPSTVIERFIIVYDSCRSFRQAMRQMPKKNILYKSTCTYTQFDANQNWTERYVSWNNEIQYYERRQITYFK